MLTCVTWNPMLPIAYRGPRDIEGLRGGGASPLVDMRTVGVAGSGGKADRCGSIFGERLIEAEMVVDPEAIDLDKFVGVARRAWGDGRNR